MICKKCAKQKHHKCKNGGWGSGTHCDCQHRVAGRVAVSPGYQIFLINKFGTK